MPGERPDREYRVQSASFQRVAFSPDSRRLASAVAGDVAGARGVVKVWSVPAGTESVRLHVAPSALAWGSWMASPAGKFSWRRQCF